MHHFRIGDKVTHGLRPSWGTGTVLEVSNKQTLARVKFPTFTGIYQESQPCERDWWVDANHLLPVPDPNWII